jgi:DNA polymerase-3 subunit gamma/tau
LDAASNNSVDDIRGLIDQVRIAPQLGNYKIYIIDEVHMLSSSAFNAFLKTLEEPPKHAIFILATTEKHKIIPTILSRCQIFDFARIKVKDIADHLASVASKEGVTADPEALHLIAQKSDGALRDALSIFDQIVTFCGSNITYKHVIENLNMLDYDYYFRIVESAIKEDIPSSLLLLNDIIEKGFDAHNFILGLADHFRNLLVCKDMRTTSLLEVGETVEQRFVDQSKLIEIPVILRSLAILSKADVEYKASKNQRLLVELALMQLCSLRQEQEKKNG